MKSVKRINLSRVLDTLKRRPPALLDQCSDSKDDRPEEVATRSLALFCESGKTDGPDEDLLYLPTLVDACESSPSAAKEAAYMIRKYLSKEYFNQPHVQYNSAMLIRILADNPGPTFTRNFDVKFVQAIKHLLREGRDPNVKQLLIETLNKFQRDSHYYEGIELLLDMWQREQTRMSAGRVYLERPPAPNIPQGYTRPLNGFPLAQINQDLPTALELSMRIEEACSSANLLTDIIHSTPATEIIHHDLAQELAYRCQLASQSMQIYISASNPPADNDTMETLIETNEKLCNTLNLHRRAILKARKLQAENSAHKAGPHVTASPTPSSGNENDSTSLEDKKQFPDAGDERDESFSPSEAQLSSSKTHSIHGAGPEGLSSKENNSNLPRKNPVYRY